MTTQTTVHSSIPTSAQASENSWQKKAILSVAFLMATTSVGPGFLTQTAVFTNIYKIDMAFPVFASMFITFGIVMNLWRIVGVSGMRIQDIANKVAPGMGYVVGILLALGAVAFNFGNVSGAALGINVLTGVDTTWGALFTGVVGCLLFVVHNASKRMDQMARYLGLFMIILIAYVAMTSLPPMGETLSAAVMPTDIGSLLLPTLTIVGGAVGGYYTGAQRLVDIGLQGKDKIPAIKTAAWAGISIAVVIRILLFLAVFGVIATGATLDSANPAADAFRQGAGEVGYFIFGLVLFVASITSVVGNSYMAISLIKTLFPIVARNEKVWCVGFIIITSLGTVTMNMPILLLMLAGLVNSIILPIVLGMMLVATRRKDIVGDYKHPVYLTFTGIAIVVVMAASSMTNISNFVSKFIG
ncbi:NRAMP family divalent metal transporter [Vibrio harveyi]|uniref:NRAMP family divalent metal transporter n=2 Tax=Vibrio harveyi TaxID=669 RepID=UPI0023807898|nr:NRAMP family divalent metal transporter [Vibrio harveyi]EKO3802992.1 divalent metal cation transporter [Vibrio harveyi]ELI0632654.1 divalent metal cation transporter [Vibrio harveyi]HDM8057434.1 divalent metal cation transporter [Vibrio harveyi]HDZ5419129.1 divalent metal cation transporter [Vibrio harveyi]